MDSQNPNGHKSHTNWPNEARAAICFTMDNMGEAADLNRGLWPDDKPVGQHYTVTTVIPEILSLLRKYGVLATYFVESWNINIYGDFILSQIVKNGHELAWHGWQHEAWAKMKDEKDERDNFERSFGKEGVGKWVAEGRVKPYCGFRPPGGIVNGDRTLKMCREYDLGYLSPAAEKGAVIDVGDTDRLVILPFKWATVDAYYYMETFAGLRKMKGEYPEEPQTPEVLVKRYITEIDKAIEEGGFLSLLFHPFLTNNPERMAALEEVLQYLAKKRDEGKIWWTSCTNVEAWIRKHPDCVGTDPKWDLSSWR